MFPLSVQPITGATVVTAGVTTGKDMGEPFSTPIQGESYGQKCPDLGEVEEFMPTSVISLPLLLSPWSSGFFY